ncbi:MAG TPA: histidinol dehydrogenase [Solirubrobacteraceae bacterium]|nr:histidinol dehydrogenase [Solirubrobacteraceae bacterium]
MAAERIRCDAAGAAAAAARVRALVPPGASVAEPVAAILADVRARGDAAVLELERRFGGGDGPLRVPAAELEAAAAALDEDLRGGLETAIANVGAVAAAGLGDDRAVDLEQGQRVTVREVPVRRAAVYAPGGRNPYPSSVVMGAVTARVAGVEEVVVVAPPHPVILGAAALCGIEEVYRMGGAQAVGALAYGTASVPRVDVIVGPGSLWVQEAKRQVADAVGIDGFAGPSDLTLIVSGEADLEPLALDLLAQAEHGEGSLVVAVSDDASVLDTLAPRLGDTPGPAVLVEVADLDAALAFAEALAPEHLQLAGADAEALAPRVRSAGCLFVGAASGTAFGDYVAGSNHVLPTDGAARFASGLSVRHFRRTMHEVRVGAAAGALARAGVPIAEAEGFAGHAASMQIRENPAP